MLSLNLVHQPPRAFNNPGILRFSLQHLCSGNWEGPTVSKYTEKKAGSPQGPSPYNVECLFSNSFEIVSQCSYLHCYLNGSAESLWWNLGILEGPSVSACHCHMGTFTHSLVHLLWDSFLLCSLRVFTLQHLALSACPETGPFLPISEANGALLSRGTLGSCFV